MIYLLFIFLVIITIRYLPFINIDASFRLQQWLKKLEKDLEETIYSLEKKNKEKEERKRKK